MCAFSISYMFGYLMSSLEQIQREFWGNPRLAQNYSQCHSCVMRQTVYLVVNSIKVNNVATFFNCLVVGLATN